METPNDSEKYLTDIETLFRADEGLCLEKLFAAASLTDLEESKAIARATRWISTLRQTHKPWNGLHDLLTRFDLSSEEGFAILCLADSLFRIPDKATADALIRDKLSDTHWDKILGKETSWSLSLTGWALTLTGKIAGLEDSEHKNPGVMLGRLIGRIGQPVIREAVKSAMHWLTDQFILGETFDAAHTKSKPLTDSGLSLTYALTAEDSRTSASAQKLFDAFTKAIDDLSAAHKKNPKRGSSGLSIKLSSLHPRFENAQRDRVMDELMPRLILLCEHAAAHNVPLMIEAEDSSKLFLALDVMQDLLRTAKLGAWDGLGFTIQAYEKRAPAVIAYLADLALTTQRHIKIRLVKGAYWDCEIKRDQEKGLSNFSVYTRKASTDLSYLACARQLLALIDWVKPVFATHNAMTIASILEITRDASRIEFQNLKGMGEELYALLRNEGYICGTSVPVGTHEALSGYIVRQLLETASSNSFLHGLYNPAYSIEALTKNPVQEIKSLTDVTHPLIRRPSELYAPERENAKGLDLDDPFVINPLLEEIAEFSKKDYSAVPLIGGEKFGPADHVLPVRNPSTGAVVGEVLSATPTHLSQAFETTHKAYAQWSRTPPDERAKALEKLADNLEENLAELMALLIKESGKTIDDALLEVRDAVDYCRYYALRAREDFAPHLLQGPSGEKNELRLAGRGVFVCISPWNNPLAIFIGQITAALVAGNAVIAKPAPQTPLIGAFASRLILECGIPEELFSFLPGGDDLGTLMVQHPLTAGVAFTGTTAAAVEINRALASKEGPLVPLIAETGGQNVLIADSSTCIDSLVDDVIVSAFRSAGQRCSSLRLLCLPHATADKIIDRLKGALHELHIGNPAKRSTDVGPVIDDQAQLRLINHIVKLDQEASLIARLEKSSECKDGSFIEPQIWEIPALPWLQEEAFGPILHVLRYDPDKLDALIEDLNAWKQGLTGGIHSRIGSVVNHVEETLNVENFYANRSMAGSVVGVQPFGSGVKAGGPFYLPRFAHERVTSTNLAAAAGNIDLYLSSTSRL